MGNAPACWGFDSKQRVYGSLGRVNDGSAAAARRCCGAALPRHNRPFARTAQATRARSPSMTASPPRELFIQGITRSGRTFRPSDWAERLAGALSCFRPGGVQAGPGSHIRYSPYCVPTVVNGVKCVIVNEALRGVEPMAWDFAMNFARDNDLQVAEACSLPPPEETRRDE
jgi:hypothetical protein